MIISIISAFLATVGFSILFHIPKRHLYVCGFIGAIGWGIYLLIEQLGYSPILATFLGAVFVAQLSSFFARKRKTPVTTFLIVGIIPLVPGLGLYRTMYALLFNDYLKALEYAILTLELSGVIAGAIIIVSLLPLLWRPRKHNSPRF